MTRRSAPVRSELLATAREQTAPPKVLKKVDFDPARFLERYYADVDDEDLAQRQAADLAAAAFGHLAWAVERKPCEALVRVFNPSSASHGWTSPHTIVQLVNDDMPFLVDSVTMALSSSGHGIHLTIHPIMKVRRSAKGRLLGLGDASGEDDGEAESFIHIEITRETNAAVLEDIRAALTRTLADVRAAVEDWRPMRAKLIEASRELREGAPGPIDLVEESCAFLDWLADDHFTLLGYREYRLQRGPRTDRLSACPGTGLGILRDTDKPPSVMELTDEARREARSTTPLVITKANARSTVHRPTRLDYIGVKVFDRQGRPVRERRFLGLFTSAAYSASPRDIPLLRLKVQALMKESGVDPRSHRGKALQHILDTFPRDDLFQGSLEDLARISQGILNLQERHKVRLFLRRDTFGRFYSCLVYLPRDHYTGKARQRVEQILAAGLEGTSIESELTISESALARLRIVVHTDPGQQIEPRVDELQAQLEEAVRSWSDHLRAELLRRLPEEEALGLLRRFAGFFSAAYQDEIDAVAAADDVQKLARLVDAGSDLEMRLRPLPAAATRNELTLLRRAEPVPLYVAVPILENMGFKVVSERPYPVRLEPQSVWIQVFELDAESEHHINPDTVATRFEECFRHVLAGDADNDRFNAFVLTAGLDWREAVLLRAYCRYLVQTGLPFSQAYMQEVLGRHPLLCRALIDQFRALFDPDMERGVADRMRKDSEEQIRKELERAVSLDEDRILRAFAAMVPATLRTNYFQRQDETFKRYVSFKLDPARIPELPLPRPQFEIFVHSQQVEAIHLRCGKIARGGLRWSDRREDFRTEILGLMKAQQVKNSVIVPNGAKGGFVCKRLPTGDRDAVQREVLSCYRQFIQGMLDVTDNIVGGKVVRPSRVLARDDDDPYLVVAADKGTATFSDVANEIAREYGFWLRDAFASGGSAGYDHKKMGITARGVWESVKRHFRELGKDARNEPFTVVGIGDMSGDVFGNGMLLSPHIKLIAAFNHIHIFIDPTPDPAVSFEERRRLFHLPRSTWDDYDRSKLSEGGGVYSRQSKSIELHPAAAKALRLERNRLTPPELIKAILRAEVDLLWNGGIGTYVKASDEPHAAAADPANDPVRVNGGELRCRVVAEGGNLGFTQRGRIEYALKGGRINTDFIDNSGGVDSSDREVNIKILLNDAVDKRKLTLAERNELLASMTDELAELVLADNYAQTQALSVVASRAGERLSEHARLIRVLEGHGLIDRSLEALPTEEQIQERSKTGAGLTRPELAVILSHAKIELTASLAKTDIPEDPFLAEELTTYFPKRLTERFGTLIARHRLRREIIAMLVSSSIVNRMGPFFVLRAEEEIGADVAQVARAYTVVRRLFATRMLWKEIEALDYRVDAEIQYDSMFEISRMMRRAVYWFLQRFPQTLDIEAMVERFHPGVVELLGELPRLLTGRSARRFKRDVQHYEGLGLPSPLAERIARFTFLTQILEIVELARECGVSATDVGELYFELGKGIRLDWIREQIETLPVDGRWQAIARATLREQLARYQRSLLRTVLDRPGDQPPRETLDKWLADFKHEHARTRRVLEEIQAAGTVDFAALSVALKEIARLL